jgi:hypothetical protein
MVFFSREHSRNFISEGKPVKLLDRALHFFPFFFFDLRKKSRTLFIWIRHSFITRLRIHEIHFTCLCKFLSPWGTWMDLIAA